MVILKDYVSGNGKLVGRWLTAQRKYKREGKLSDEKIALLNKIGMNWFCEDKWEIGFGYAETYFRQYGDLLVKRDYITNDGYALGRWAQNQRSAYKGATRNRLTDKQKKRFDDIGFVVDVNEYKWDFAYERAAEYYRYHGTVSVPRRDKVDGIGLQS